MNTFAAPVSETLKTHDARATFFVSGLWAERNSDALRSIAESGRAEIGTLGNTHTRMSALSQRQQELDLTTAQSIIGGVTGKKVELFRAPHGEYSDALLSVAERLGFHTIQWGIDPLGAQEASAYEITQRVLQSVTPGSIVRLAADNAGVAEALGAVIEGLKNKGYSFRTVGELILRENFTIDQTGKQTRR